MLARLAHRGPDGHGSFDGPGVYLGHHRLSIVDPEHGDQPFVDAETGVAVICNGAIYNHMDLRKDLLKRGCGFASRNDCEVILHGYLAYGLDILDRLDGIFALAIWDPRSRAVHLARDAFGVKPMLYLETDGTLRFASEAKAIFADPDVRRALDPSSFHAFMNLRYVPGTATLFEGVRSVPPGCVLSFQAGKGSKLTRYFELANKSTGPITIEEAAEETRHRLATAVKRQIMSDVPIGVYLSGGLDSSSIVALACEATTEHFDTFAMGFGSPGDELIDAREVADAFSTRHHELTLSGLPLTDYPAAIWHAEEPKENILQGFELSRFASAHVKVALTGLGGDELFAGYEINRILEGLDRVRGAASAPGLRQPLAGLEALVLGAASGRLPKRLDHFLRGFQVLCGSRDLASGYRVLRNAWGVGLGAASSYYGPAVDRRAMVPVSDLLMADLPTGRPARMDDIERAEFHSKMVNDLLSNEDRTAMAHGVETRVPFLDRELVEFAFSIPYATKLQRGRTKPIIREAMRTTLPAATLEKKKAGFTFDSMHLFQTQLKHAARRILTPERIRARGWFDAKAIQALNELEPHPHLRWHFFLLWLAVGFEIWAQIFIDRNAADDRLAVEDFYA